VTGLTDADLQGQNFDADAIRATLWLCDILVPHDARFDRAFLARRFPDLVERPWGCTVNDMDWQAHGLGGRSLAHLLYEAGHFYDAHRAGPDCWALACLLASRAEDGRTCAAHLIDAVRHSSTARTLPCAQVTEIIDPAWEYEVADRSAAPIKPRLRTRSCLGHDLELHRSASLSLDDSGAITKRTYAHQVTYPDLDQIAATQLAVDSQVE
jgi:DNA polymerase III epsilon subunit-like protein